MVRLTATALLLAGVVGGAGAGIAQAQTTACDSYSEACIEPTRRPDLGPFIEPSVLPARQTRPAPGGELGPEPEPRPGRLTVTGGELVLLLTVGSGALAGGAALVVAGRRRRATPA